MSVYLRNAEIGRNVGYYMELGKLSGAMAHQQKLVEVGFDYKKYKVLPGSAWVNAACFVNLNVDMVCRHSNSETALAFYQKYGHFPEKKQPLSWQTKAVSSVCQRTPVSRKESRGFGVIMDKQEKKF